MVIRVTGAQNNTFNRGDGTKRVKILGSGFLLNDDEADGWQLEVVVLNENGDDEEESRNIKVWPVDMDEVTGNDLYVNIAVRNANESIRRLILKEVRERIVGGACANAGRCDSLDRGVVINYSTEEE